LKHIPNIKTKIPLKIPVVLSASDGTEAVPAKPAELVPAPELDALSTEKSNS
jgi:hypothetical protein